MIQNMAPEPVFYGKNYSEWLRSRQV